MGELSEMKMVRKRRNPLGWLIVIVLLIFWVIMGMRSFVHEQDQAGYTALHRAALKGGASLAAWYLFFDADVNARSQNGWTPLHMAVTPEMTTLLLNHGADPNAVNDADETPLHLAAYDGRASIVDLLLAAKSEVNARNGNAETPLHLAAGRGSLDSVVLLLAAGADTTARDVNGHTPLQRAQGQDNPQLLRLLKKTGSK